MVAQGHRLRVGGESMIGQACARRQPVIAQDVSEAEARYVNPLLPDTRAEMALPLIVGDRVLGALTIQADRPYAFTEEDLVVLSTVSGAVAVALNNAMLYADLRLRSEIEAAVNEFTSQVLGRSTVVGRATTGLEALAHRIRRIPLVLWIGSSTTSIQQEGYHEPSHGEPGGDGSAERRPRV
jgi:GAF domain-containing protein